MKLGIVTYFAHDAHESLTHVRATTAAVLRGTHELLPYSPEYAFASRARQRELLHDWLSQCDAIVGPIDGHVLHARQESGSRTPYLCLLLGHLSRGGVALATAHPSLRTSDVLIGNCRADLALANQFFENATARCVPFGFDASLYHPADDASQRAIRERCAIDASDRIIVYAGRITLEKNLHTLLKAFRVVLEAVPAARLVIAGTEIRAPFHEFGVFSLGLTRALRRLMAQLDLPEDRVRFVGQQSADELRAWYSIADALANLTLHHDENFGLVQIEAMACGLPAVGTAWGGLNDTIVDGVTGYQVPAIVTAAGVKVDWWQAANRLVQLLQPSEANRAIRQSCREHVHAHYSMERYCQGLQQAIETAVGATPHSSEPLRLTSFAKQYWNACYGPPRGGAGNEGLPPYRRGAEAWQLYQDLIAQFAGRRAPTTDVADAPAWCLPSPLTMDEHGVITIHDPIYPRRITAPPTAVGLVRHFVSLFSDRPVIVDDDIDATVSGSRDALVWMRDAGLIVPTETGACGVPRACSAIGRASFSVQEVDHSVDLVSIA